MATFTERLAILITADGTKAVGELKKVGTEAERSASRVEDRWKKAGASLTSFGATALTAGSVAAVGLFKLADAAGDYGEAVNKAGVIFGSASKQVEAFGETASDTAGISKTAAVSAASLFGQFGKAAGLAGDDLASFSTDLTQLAGDLASFNNTTTDDAITALGAGLRGESEPLRRFGILLDDATLKQRALELGIYNGTGALSQQQRVLAAQAEILSQSSDAAGDFARTSDSLANRQRQLAADFENLKVEVGQGLVPFFEAALGGVSKLVQGFNGLDETTKGTIGTLAGIATTGTIAVGAMSLIAGQAIKMRDGLKAAAEWARNLNLNLRGISPAGAAGLVAYAVALERINAAAGAATRERAFGGINTADASANVDGFVHALNEAIGASDSLAEQTRSSWLRNVVPIFGDAAAQVLSFKDANAAATEQIDKMKGVLDGLSASDAQSFVREFAAAGGDAVKVFQDGKLVSVVDILNGYLDETGKSGAAAARGLDAVGGAGADAAGGVTQATDALDRLKKALAGIDADRSIGDLGFDAAAAGAKAFAESLDRSTGFDDVLDSAAGAGEALGSFSESVKALPKGIDASSLALGKYNDMARESVSRLLAAGKANRDYLASLVASGEPVDTVRARASELTDEYARQFDQLGLNAEQQQEYLELLGLTPEQVETALVLSGYEEAKFKIDTYLALLGEELPESVSTEVLSAVDQGDLKLAADILAFWRAVESAKTVTIQVRADLTPAQQAINSGFQVRNQSGTGIPIRAAGGPVSWGTPYLVGERGPEYMVPSGNGHIVPNHAMPKGGDGASLGTIVNIDTIVTPDPQTTGDSLARGLRRVQYLEGGTR